MEQEAKKAFISAFILAYILILAFTNARITHKYILYVLYSLVY